MPALVTTGVSVEGAIPNYNLFNISIELEREKLHYFHGQWLYWAHLARWSVFMQDFSEEMFVVHL